MAMTMILLVPGMLAKAIKDRPDLHFGVYFSHFEWYHPLYLQDKNNSYKTQNYVKASISSCQWNLW